MSRQGHNPTTKAEPRAGVGVKKYYELTLTLRELTVQDERVERSDVLVRKVLIQTDNAETVTQAFKTITAWYVK